MRPLLLGFPLVAALLTAAPSPASAIGCLSGGAMGAVAGHYTGHTILGAIGGCVLGRHLHNRQRAQPATTGEPAGQPDGTLPPGRGMSPAVTGPVYQPGYPRDLPPGTKPSPWTHPEAYAPGR